MSTERVAEAPHFRFRVVPVLTAILLGIGLPYLASEIVEISRHYSHLVPPMADEIGYSYAIHFMLVVLTLIAIGAMQWLVPADYGLHLPRGKTYLGWALLWGLAGGLALGGLRYLAVIWEPEVFVRQPHFAVAGHLLGKVIDYGAFVSPSEEVLFRALLVTFLAAKMPGTVRLAGRSVEVAGLVVALLYAAYAMMMFPSAIVTIADAACFFALGVAYAYWQVQSRSVVAPIVGHSVAGIVMYIVPVMLAFAPA